MSVDGGGLDHRPRRQGSRRDARARRRVARRSPTASCWCWWARRAAASRRCCAASPASRSSTRGADRASTASTSRDAEPRDRDIAMVFQSYALYPHLTVRDNLAFGLKMRKTPQARDRAPRRRGGGDARPRRRCSTAGRRSSRAGSGSAWRWGAPWCGGPRVFLFDEPLSNLDASLRGQMRVELMRLHQRLGATMVYVTHDQVEAMTLADRIAVLEPAARCSRSGRRASSTSGRPTCSWRSSSARRR